MQYRLILAKLALTAALRQELALFKPKLPHCSTVRVEEDLFQPFLSTSWPSSAFLAKMPLTADLRQELALFKPKLSHCTAKRVK